MKLNITIIFLFLTVSILCQDTTGSLAFKKNRPVKPRTNYFQPDLSYQIYQQFKLIQEANTGNPVAQHELGLRYLLGEDQVADTPKAVYWIRKAALQNLPAAAFNYGILLFNGIGVPWNPFEAYKNFMIALKDTMPQALYVVGILNTDNLIVKQDWGKAYYYIKLASDKGFKPASDILDDVKKQLPAGFDTSGTLKSYQPPPDADSPGLVFIDFDRPVTNLSEEVSDTLLFGDLLGSGNKEMDSIVIRDKGKLKITADPSDISILEESASWGSPEALTLLGNFYEKGIYFKKNLVTAAAYYIRAARLESFRSKILLYNLIKNETFMKEMKDAAVRKEREAMFVWYGLYSFSLDETITEKDAVDLLVNSASDFYLPSVIELGLLHYTGKYFQKNISAAFDLWNTAANGGFKEADVRIDAAIIYGEYPGNKNEAIKTLVTGEGKGSLLAQVALGKAVEQNLYTSGSSSEDIMFYRNAAQRGSRYAFLQLQRRYNDIRPPDPQFDIN